MNPFFEASKCRRASTWRWLVLAPAMITGDVIGAGWTEDFTSVPVAHGWHAAGDASLFAWDATNQCLAVTWDSARSNSYFVRSLETVLTKSDNFNFAFDLRLSDVVIGVNANRPFTFQIAAGLVRLASATQTNLQRGSGVNAAHGPRNLAEFTWFPDSGFGATVSPSIASSNNQPAFTFTFPLELDPSALFHIGMSYTASDQTLRTTMTRNGAAFGPIGNVVLGGGFTDFRLDHFAISSYSDEGADGSILAHGSVDNVSVTVPPPAIASLTHSLTNGIWAMTLESQAGFVYTMERSTDLMNWTNVAGPEPGSGGYLVLTDVTPPPAGAVYRVKADKP